MYFHSKITFSCASTGRAYVLDPGNCDPLSFKTTTQWTQHYDRVHTHIHHGHMNVYILTHTHTHTPWTHACMHAHTHNVCVYMCTALESSQRPPCAKLLSFLLLFFSFLYLILRQGLTIYPDWLAWILIYNPGLKLRDLSASDSQVMGWKICATMPGFDLSLCWARGWPWLLSLSDRFRCSNAELL